MIAHAGLPWSNARMQLRMFPSFPVSVNLLPPERNREAMDDDELIAAMAIGDDTALRELFARHALAGGHEPVHRPAAAAVRLRLRGRGPRIRPPGAAGRAGSAAARCRDTGRRAAPAGGRRREFPRTCAGNRVTGPVYTAARHAWLAAHLAAVRAGRLTPEGRP